jgi:N-acetylmuramoyl-L-alanine amidase
MKSVLPRFLAALLVLCPGAFEASAARPPTAQAGDYVRLMDWAKANGFELSWTRREETLELKNHDWKVVLTVDSRQAQVNGVQIWLLFPLVLQRGSPCLANLDLQTTLQPILRPPKSRPRTQVQHICLDPGHGGKDPGYCIGPKQEKQFTLLLAQELREELKRAGFKVTLTRSRDVFVDLPARPDLANRRKADLFVSLHFNAAVVSRNSVRGAQAYCLTPAGATSTNARGEGLGAGWCAGHANNGKNMLLAYRTQKALVENLGVEDHGVRRARFAVLRDARMPAVLIEAGFMSNPAEARKIVTDAYRRQLARAIVQGICAYKRVVEEGS